MNRILVAGMLLALSSSVSMAQGNGNPSSTAPSGHPAATAQNSAMTVTLQASRNGSNQMRTLSAPVWRHPSNATFGPSAGEGQFASGYSSEGSNG